MKQAKLHIDQRLPQALWLSNQLSYDLTSEAGSEVISLLYAHDTNMRLTPLDDFLVAANRGQIVKTIFFSWYNFNMNEPYFQRIFGTYDTPKNSIIWNPKYIQILQLPYDIKEVKYKISKLIEYA